MKMWDLNWKVLPTPDLDIWKGDMSRWKNKGKTMQAGQSLLCPDTWDETES